jgi:hypothetical protein
LIPRSGSTTVLAWLLVSVLALGGYGCAAFRSYKSEMDKTLSLAAGGDVGGAIRVLEKNNGSKDKDLLYDMEMGELRRMNREFEASQVALGAAEAKVEAWEAASKLNAGRAGATMGSLLLNDKVRVYEGHDYEKVMVTTRMAMNHLALGDWDNARVQIKRTHEREALIRPCAATST